MLSDKSLPIMHLTYRLILEVDLAVCQLPRHQRPCLGRRGEAAAFDHVSLEAAPDAERMIVAIDRPGAGLDSGSEAWREPRPSVSLARASSARVDTARRADQDVCRPSGDDVAGEIEGDLSIVPLVAGSGDMEDELFTLNATGKAIWDQLDGRRSLAGAVAA